MKRRVFLITMSILVFSIALCSVAFAAMQSKTIELSNEDSSYFPNEYIYYNESGYNGYLYKDGPVRTERNPGSGGIDENGYTSYQKYTGIVSNNGITFVKDIESQIWGGEWGTPPSFPDEIDYGPDKYGYSGRIKKVGQPYKIKNIPREEESLWGQKYEGTVSR
ncbi:hypothetical protein R9X47_01355 [Wukongibacter baidiensis]|uniref:hypothetical protein n=1 Tax=Wukongibacter baidiensis TaxID=1723361 RepID=UPI003D7FCD71